MDFFGDVWGSIRGFLFPNKNNVTPTESTVAAFNRHPMEFDITLQPMDKISPHDLIMNSQIDVQPSLELQQILDSLLESFTDDSTKIAFPHNVDTPRVTNMDIPDKIGHSFVKVAEDATGQSIEILYESVTDSPNIVENATNQIMDVLNGTQTKERFVSETNYVNVYIIAALVLIIFLIISIGGFLWCKRNRLRAEKRNLYPVIAVVNQEYMDPQLLKNNQKLKNIP